MSEDRFIDDALARVPVPKDLRAKLRPDSLFADAELDRLLTAVPVPVGLEDSIRSSVQCQLTRFQDGALDLSRFATGRGPDAASPLHPNVTPRQRIGLPSVVGEIVSVITALGLVILLTIAGIGVSRHLEGPPRESPMVTRLDFDEAIDSMAAEWPLRFDVPEGGRSKAEHVPRPQASLSAAVTGDGGQATVARSVPASEGNALDPAFGLSSATVVRGAAVASLLPSGWAGPPSMATVDIPEAVRRSVPRVRGYDLAFEMTTGEQPFVDPASDPILAVNRPPLSLETAGFERLTAARDGGEEPLRAEDILAVVSPPPGESPKPQAVGLSLHEVRGLRSVGTERTVLLEVAATAGPVARPAQPREVTLVLDQSAAGDPAIWRRICRAIVDLAWQLSPDDRVSFVLCGPRPRLVLDASGPRALAALAADLEWQPASPSSDMEAGLRLAQPADRIIVVAHANSLDAPGAHLSEALTAWQKALSTVGGDSLACKPAGGTRFIVLDPETPASAEPAAPTFGRTASDMVSIRRALIRQVTGQETLVARACSLDVRFDPRQVARYRLIGHRQSAVESLADSSPRGADLHAGETVRVVYELVPRAPSVGPGFASAVLSWTGPRGELRRLEAGPNRSAGDLGDGLPSPHGCELLLAAGLGDLVSGSAHVTRRPALNATVTQLIESWRSRGDITATGDALARGHERRVVASRKAL